MVLTLLNPVIIRLPWIREDNIIIRPVTSTLIINSYGLIISTKEIPILLKIKELMVTLFVILIKGLRNAKNRLLYLRYC